MPRAISMTWLRGAGAGVALALSGSAAAQPLSCPTPGEGERLVFRDEAILMRTGLAVNPDGAAASYTPGDHGYTYVSNGVNLLETCWKTAGAWAAAQERTKRGAGAIGREPKPGASVLARPSSVCSRWKSSR